MKNPIQIIRDFRKWREEKYDDALRTELLQIAKEEYRGLNEGQAFYLGLYKGITERKTILKRVKI